MWSQNIFLSCATILYLNNYSVCTQFSCATIIISSTQVNTSINLYVKDYLSTGIYIKEIEISPTFFTLHFTGDIRPHLTEDDIILLDLGTMLVDGASQNSWTPTQEYIAYTVAHAPGAQRWVLDFLFSKSGMFF